MGKVLAYLGVLVALLAIGVGTVGKLCPNLFFKIPKFGFMPWAMMGGRMPPHFDHEPLTEAYFHRWAKDGDVIQASMGKAGTMWLAQVVQLLKSGGKEDYKLLTDEIGFMEMLRHPDDTVEDRLARETKKRKPEYPMSWFSHKFPNAANYGMDVKKHPQIKYIGIVREGKEVIRSFVPFLNSHTNEFSAMWGGFPPLPMTKEAALSMFAVDMPDFYFGYLKAWWALRGEPNVLLLHYNDLKLDLRAQVNRIASFLEIDSSAFIDEVLEKASFKYMKANGHKYVIRVGKHADILAVKEGGHINKGQSGGTDDFFTAEMNATWDAAYAANFRDADPAMLAWASEGGRF